MERTTDSASRKFSIKVDSKELERIIQARKNLDDVKALAVYAAHYRDLGWSPVALETENITDLEVDFDQPQASWLWLLMDFALQEVKVGLAIRPEPHSRLFVLRVKPSLGRSLDRLGNWRSACIARLRDAWEHHFLVLPPDWQFPPEPVIVDPEAPLSVLGPGSLVPVPPSVDSSQRVWEWLTLPWEQPPVQPSPELLILLEDCGFIARKSIAVVEDLPSWKEIYPRISHSEKLLQALLAPEEESRLYYRKILYEAMQAGFQDLELLLGLLWHAPHSEIRLDPEGREQLALWAESLRELLAPEPSGQAGAAREPESAAASSSPEDLVAELQDLAAQTLELEQQLEHLEDLGAPQEMGPEDDQGPASGANGGLQDRQKEFAELRRAVEDFLAGMKDLTDPE